MVQTKIICLFSFCPLFCCYHDSAPYLCSKKCLGKNGSIFQTLAEFNKCTVFSCSLNTLSLFYLHRFTWEFYIKKNIYMFITLNSILPTTSLSQFLVFISPFSRLKVSTINIFVLLVLFFSDFIHSLFEKKKTHRITHLWLIFQTNNISQTFFQSDSEFFFS